MMSSASSEIGFAEVAVCEDGLSWQELVRIMFGPRGGTPFVEVFAVGCDSEF